MLQCRAMKYAGVLWLVVLCSVLLAAQKRPAADPTGEPAHHLAFQNEYVRIFSLELAPRATTPPHRHANDYFLVALGQGEFADDTTGQPAKKTKLQEGAVVFAPANSSHALHNDSNLPLRAVLIEFLRDDQARTSPYKWDVDRGLSIFDGGTQDILFVKDGVRASEFELQPHGMIAKHHHAGPHLVVAVSDLDLHSDVAGKGSSRIQLKSGETKWIPGGFTHTVMNMGSAAKFVTLEFH